MTPLERALTFAGNQARLARLLGIDHTNVSHWVRGTKRVPDKHRIALARMTRGTRFEIDPLEWSD